MPSQHRAFLHDVAQLPSLRWYLENQRADEKLMIIYNECLQQLASWRSKHIAVVTTHIIMPSRKLVPELQKPKPEEVKQVLSVTDESQLRGTGGSALIPFLKQARQETLEAGRAAIS